MQNLAFGGRKRGSILQFKNYFKIPRNRPIAYTICIGLSQCGFQFF